ncbi:D-alanyl-D-alanine carboxypeptidase family protein [Jiangella alkaliphila]|uniref:D-alanyl-D-alanine carboxypeptidase (Penicillin-binding protein 5/6) n=1 Tax=Jiangella alkaliphila TaxID=419479 RepID=A0A1H2J0P0_9ACTN|nr:D-alanyl-D-alanine carboxypeptidase family protein [Jiangella alkaliphila]SDU49882.1 D-alanyl-D-alanine carboxypeptidase (penicillin-binding protein 5/6) [Jiangella alkaliphila]
MGPALRSHRSHRAWIVPVAALVMLGSGALLPAHAETPAATAPATPPSTILEPPADSPVDEIVGGEELAATGVPLVSTTAPPLPVVDGQSWLIADAETGDVLAAYSPHERRPPASTIKLLTALATGSALEPDETYVATEEDASVEGSRVGIVATQTYTVDQLLHGLMLASGNDAAHAIAEAAGGQDVTVDKMNDEARRLGAFDTKAVTPHGLDSPGQLSSAYDLALIGREALDDETIAALAATPAYDFPGTDGATFQIQNQNRLLGSYEGTIGLKTGFTTLAGHTFVGAVERDGRTLIATVLGAEGRAEDTAAALFDWALAAPKTQPIGHLVAPDEVEAMVTDAADEGDILGRNPLEDYGDALTSPGGSSDDVPPVVWLSLAAAALAGGLGFALRRRRPKSSGRYSSR